MAKSKLYYRITINMGRFRKMRLYVYMLWLISKGYTEEEVCDKAAVMVEKWLKLEVIAK